MTVVSFYILADEGPGAAARLACRLAEKAHLQGHRLYIHAADAGAAADLNQLLWTFRQGSFVPHALAADLDRDDSTPVALGAQSEPPAGWDDVLINLDAEVPAFFSRFRRALEIVTPATRAAARQRYKFYQDRGYSLKTHQVE